MILLFSIMSEYRETTQLSGKFSTAERIAILQEASRQRSYYSESIIIENVGSVIGRLYEVQSIELLSLIESGIPAFISFDHLRETTNKVNQIEAEVSK